MGTHVVKLHSLGQDKVSGPNGRYLGLEVSLNLRLEGSFTQNIFKLLNYSLSCTALIIQAP